MSFLEISQSVMHQLYYGYLKPKYRDKCTLLFTDTDSFCCHIQTEEVSFLMIQHIFAVSSPGIFMDSSNFADTAYFADSTND